MLQEPLRVVLKHNRGSRHTVQLCAAVPSPLPLSHPRDMPDDASVVPANQTFLFALQRHLDALSPQEQADFASKTPEDVLAAARALDEAHRSRSRTRRYLDRFSRIVRAFQGYFAAVDALASSHPDIAGLVWGGLRCIIAVRRRCVHAVWQRVSDGPWR
jgi:hypothetical protein